MMLEVASLRYGTIFKKAFCVPSIFNAFASDVTGVEINVKKVETEKKFDPIIGLVDVTFDLFAEDVENRIIVDIQHERLDDHYHRFLHYTCAAILQQVASSTDYKPPKAVYTIVVLTSGDRHKTDTAITDFDPKKRNGEGLGEIPHKLIYIAPKYVNDDTPEAMREWLQAIDDSLDEQVDTNAYERAEIQHIFDLIQKDKVTPQDRAKMIEESHQEEIYQKKVQEGREEGLAEGRAEGRAEGLQLALIRQLQRKFGNVPDNIIAQIEATENYERLASWLDALWDVDSLAEINFNV
ncbi:MAG: PD-(D/E)XK nuclease family transposase [Chloroflexota bacterium]